jgi:hypothetical protein
MINWQQHNEGTNSSKPSANFCSDYSAYFHYASSQQAFYANYESHLHVK